MLYFLSNSQMYSFIRDKLNEAANDNDVRVFVLTGAGNFYSSGNDLSNFTNMPPEGPQKLAADSRVLLKYLIFIV